MKLPTTRYYGSKRKIVESIWSALERLGIEYDSVLDPFGGTGVVSYYMAQKGKEVIYNDVMAFNCEIAKALLCSPKGTAKRHGGMCNPYQEGDKYSKEQL